MTTPIRRQYLDIKGRYPGMILLFQIGDFYEVFDEDAQTLSRELGLVLTRKHFGKDDVRPLAGVPVRSLESHLAKLIGRGYKVAVCEQVTPAGKGLVEREVTRIVTPGTVVEPGLLESGANNYLAAVVAGDRASGFAYADVTTGEFRATELARDEAMSEVERVAPAELLALGGTELPTLELRAITRLAGAQYEGEAAVRALREHFGVTSLGAFGLDGRPLAARAAGLVVAYLRETQPDALTNFDSLGGYEVGDHLRLDPLTLRNLEVFHGWDFSGAVPTGSLVATLDLCETAMGKRLFRRRLRHPSVDLKELEGRLDLVGRFVASGDLRAAVRSRLEGLPDAERLLGRVRRRLAAPDEVLGLAQGLGRAAALKALLAKQPGLKALAAKIDPCEDVVELVRGAISDRAPGSLEQGGVIKKGYSEELDALRDTLGGGRRFVADLEERERARTGIRSLKVGYNKVFGYYIEVTRPNLRHVPADYVRKQTLTSAERFVTLELKEHESLIANTRERITELEASLYRQLCDRVAAAHQRVGRTADAVGCADLYAALAECAERFGFVRPELTDGDELEIEGGRHPMIERMLEPGAFVPNDARLSRSGTQVMLITAPNMAGKSVYLRQVALVVLLAQAGSFVPASRARVGLVDRIFTRIGLSDYTHRGHSSFMIEMIETAHILRQATPRSLVLLDEVGRGTSTADGVAIARAIVEYIHNSPRVGAKTLFATHYHELTDCAEYLPRVENFRLAVRERDGRVEYLHRVEPGVATRSLGLYVAKMAGLPQPVLRRAKELIERGGERPAARPSAGAAEVAAALEAIDVDEMSPVEALTKLYELQRRVRSTAKAQ